MCGDCSAAKEPVQPLAHEQALRLVLAIAFDRETALACLGARQESAVALWPSTLYHLLATAALECPAVWHRCQRRLDLALEPWTAPFRHRSSGELARLFVEGRETCSGIELGALLWCIVKRRGAATLTICTRLGAELETIALHRLGADGKEDLKLPFDRWRPNQAEGRWNSG